MKFYKGNWVRYGYPLIFIFIFLLTLSFFSAIFKNERLHFFLPDFLVLFCVWTALRRNFFLGGFMCLALGYGFELFSTAIQGTSLFSAIAIYLFVRFTIHFTVVKHRVGLAILTAGAFCLHQITVLAVLGFLGKSEPVVKHLLFAWLPGISATLVASLILYRQLGKLERFFAVRIESKALFDDEILLESGQVN